MKVVIVGAGAVGSTFAYALAQSGLANEIVLVDHNEDLVNGQVLDLAHGYPFFPTVSICMGDSTDYADAQLIVVTAGAAQKPGESRIDLLRQNSTIVRSIMSEIKNQNATGVVLIVTNPVDVMTYVALQEAAGSKCNILGSGTVLDSARLRYSLGKYLNIDAHSVHAYMLGEHGDSEFAAWSMSHIAGMPINEFCKNDDNWMNKRDQIEQDVRDSAYHIIGYKGATWFAVGLALVQITKAILRGGLSVLPVSTRLDGEYGLKDVCLSVPCIVSTKGVVKVVGSTLPENEYSSLSSSAVVIKKAIAQALS